MAAAGISAQRGLIDLVTVTDQSALPSTTRNGARPLTFCTLPALATS
jgi:hypothetical protein